LAFLAAFDPGDRVALAAPYYPPYLNILTSLGMVPVVIPTGPETRFQPSVAALSALDPPPDGLILASPCNPAGTMLHADELAAIAAWCAATGVRIVSDEIYHGLTYDRPAPTAAASSAAGYPGTITIGSFSKYFAMTGWRIGWMVLPDDLVRPAECLAQNFFISAPHIAQVAAEAAFDCGPELEANIARYRRSRDLLLAALPPAGFALGPAEGAFYLWADVGHLTNDSEAFCARMLAEALVSAAPGVDFDRARGNRFVRLSYCGPEADLALAAERLKAWTGRG
jgi:aspartate/methionine/tyrosine aminotransferase